MPHMGRTQAMMTRVTPQCCLAMLTAMCRPESVTNLTADRRAVVVMVAETSIERDQPVALALSGVLAACPSCQDFKPVPMPAAIGSATAIPTSDEQARARLRHRAEVLRRNDAALAGHGGAGRGA